MESLVEYSTNNSSHADDVFEQDKSEAELFCANEIGEFHVKQIDGGTKWSDDFNTDATLCSLELDHDNGPSDYSSLHKQTFPQIALEQERESQSHCIDEEIRPECLDYSEVTSRNDLHIASHKVLTSSCRSCDIEKWTEKSAIEPPPPTNQKNATGRSDAQTSCLENLKLEDAAILLDELQKNHVRLLQKLAQAENTIDVLRFSKDVTVGLPMPNISGYGSTKVIMSQKPSVISVGAPREGALYGTVINSVINEQFDEDYNQAESLLNIIPQHIKPSSTSLILRARCLIDQIISAEEEICLRDADDPPRKEMLDQLCTSFHSIMEDFEDLSSNSDRESLAAALNKVDEAWNNLQHKNKDICETSERIPLRHNSTQRDKPASISSDGYSKWLEVDTSLSLQKSIKCDSNNLSLWKKQDSTDCPLLLEQPDSQDIHCIKTCNSAGLHLIEDAEPARYQKVACVHRDGRMSSELGLQHDSGCDHTERNTMWRTTLMTDNISQGHLYSHCTQSTPIPLSQCCHLPTTGPLSKGVIHKGYSTISASPPILRDTCTQTQSSKRISSHQTKRMERHSNSTSHQSCTNIIYQDEKRRLLHALDVAYKKSCILQRKSNHMLKTLKSK